MTTTRMTWCCVLAVSFLFASEGSAQPPGRGQGGFGGMRGRGGITALLSNEAVQKELGLAGDALEKVKGVAESMQQDMMGEMAKLGGGGFGNFRELSAEDRTKLMTKMNELRQGLMAKALPKLKEALSSEQFTRLQQIGWQAEGSMAFAEPELAKALEITKEQAEKIMTINQEFGQKQREMMAAAFEGGGGGGGGDVMAKMQELTKERDAKAIETLTKEQQEKFATLKGKPFDLAQLRGPGGPGGGRRGTAGRPGGKKAE